MTDPARGRVLLALARASLAAAFGLGDSAPPREPWLEEPGASFVTLRREGELRGCVGTIQAYRPLGDDVWANARAAAFSDSRFPPLSRGELGEIALEVSLLSAAEPLSAATETEALALLRPGIDGVILECLDCRATFLPQVWEQLPDPREFLGHLRRKADLPSDLWSPEIRLWRYTVSHWEE